MESKHDIHIDQKTIVDFSRASRNRVNRIFWRDGSFLVGGLEDSSRNYFYVCRLAGLLCKEGV